MREREGLTYQELSERTGIARTKLSLWSWRLRREQRARNGFVEIVPRETTSEAGSRLELILPGGARLLIARGFDEETLRRVLSLLGSRC